MTFKEILYGYFSKYGGQPAHFVNEVDLQNIAINATLLAQKAANNMLFKTSNGFDTSEVQKYLVDRASYYGVDAIKFYNYVISDNAKLSYIENFLKTAVPAAHNTVSQQLGMIGEDFGNAVFGGIGNFLKNFFKPLFPVLIIAVVLIIGYVYYNKQNKK